MAPLPGARAASAAAPPTLAPVARRLSVPGRRPVSARAEADQGSASSTTTSTVEPKAAAAPSPSPPSEKKAKKGLFGLGDLLGPIGLTIGADKKKDEKKPSGLGLGTLDNMLGPIGLTVGKSSEGPAVARVAEAGSAPAEPSAPPPSPSTGPAAVPVRNTLTTAEWRARYEPDGCVDLWVEEEFNAGSRLVGGRAAHFGATPGAGSGEGRTGDATVPVHTLRILNPNTGQALEVAVPEDRYILHEAEDQGLLLPYACRMGCCTACAVRITEDADPSNPAPALLQPESLGVAAELRARGFALMCVARPTRPVTLAVAGEDEVYDLQFGDAFDAIATNPDGPGVERDDFALEIANMDE